MRTLSALLVLAVASVATAQPPDNRPPPVPTAKTLPPPVKSEYLDYTAGAAQAARDGRPFVTFLGCQPRSITGAVVCSTGELTGYDAPAVVVSVPGGDWLHWKATLSATATDAQIRATFAQKAVSQAAVPFEPSNAERDDELDGHGLWPEGLEFPPVRRFRRARFTQEIAVTSGMDRISPVLRATLEEKWRVSGGMVGLHGWRSDVYSNGVRPQTWTGNISVVNGYFWQPQGGWGTNPTNRPISQNNRGRIRSYPDGARFLDVLSTDRGVFAVRQREKINGKWDYAVLFEDASAEPHGYRAPSLKECAACHREAGTGSYAAALVPGGDETFSDPIAGIE